MNHLHRRALLSGLTALCLAPGAGLAQHAATPRPDRRSGPAQLRAVATDWPAVALTFDDGPHPVHTPALLDLLAARRVRATFYVIGAMARRHPDLLRRIVAEGHEIGNHSFAHPPLSILGTAGLLREIDRTQDIVWRETGHVPVTMRPPYGALAPWQARLLAAERHLPAVRWSVDPQDWLRPGASVVAQRIVAGARPGAIILAHDIHAPTIRAIPAALDGLTARGLACVTLSELLGWGRWGPGARPRRVLERNRGNDAGTGDLG